MYSFCSVSVWLAYDLSAWVGCWSVLAFAVSGKPSNRFNDTSWMAVFTPTDRPKSIRIRWEIEIYDSVFVFAFWSFP